MNGNTPLLTAETDALNGMSRMQRIWNTTTPSQIPAQSPFGTPLASFTKPPTSDPQASLDQGQSTKILELEDQNNRFKHDIDAFKSRIADLEKEKKNMAAKLQRVNASAKNVLAYCEKLEKKSKEKDAELEAANADLGKTKELSQTLGAEVGRLKAELENRKGVTSTDGCICATIRRIYPTISESHLQQTVAKAAALKTEVGVETFMVAMCDGHCQTDEVLALNNSAQTDMMLIPPQEYPWTLEMLRQGSPAQQQRTLGQSSSCVPSQEFSISLQTCLKPYSELPPSTLEFSSETVIAQPLSTPADVSLRQAPALPPGNPPSSPGGARTGLPARAISASKQPSCSRIDVDEPDEAVELLQALKESLQAQSKSDEPVTRKRVNAGSTAETAAGKRAKTLPTVPVDEVSTNASAADRGEVEDGEEDDLDSVAEALLLGLTEKPSVTGRGRGKGPKRPVRVYNKRGSNKKVELDTNAV
eukprot:Protomagalhaensia_sp_Gyna_25__1442@NODE_172_length_4653_cov_470_453186_g134_i0_p2_GENE_NODE_172_length_4653_cov_470_453186_g134_i0NODE_172_length_4653_cov_470_453186_g134_i0_p2_ORF_typecomplete_len475_score75_99CENPF_leu_zip/PF10473_9/0_0002MAP65_ASE1/PF03999_12/0_00034MAP65_ASE1/PF03999_12/6_8e02HOOK/PF05622_12/0_00035HOOK/PF05622_12/2_4e03Myosin_tail_1/PF01576_19/0_00035Leu_zip/PF15294_6/0_00074Leu_zip/PF15294_6/2e03Filament/PF00038_21/0_0015DUF3584/PF12128_8/0_0026DUF4763/PF15960_5/0_0039MscS